MPVFCSLLCSYQKLINLYLMALTFTFPLMTRRCVRVTPPHTSRPTRKKRCRGGRGAGGWGEESTQCKSFMSGIRTEKKGKCSAPRKENFSDMLLLLHVKGRAKEKAAHRKACRVYVWLWICSLLLYGNGSFGVEGFT